MMVRRYYINQRGGLDEDDHGELMFYAAHASLEAVCCDLFDMWMRHHEDIPNDLSDAIELVTKTAGGE